MDGEEWSGRSDSGYSNTSSPRGSTLTLHPTVSSPPAADPAKLPRPLSAPGHLQLVPRLVLPNQSTHTQTETPPSSSKTSKSSSPRPEKPTPPPKPASIRRAVSNLARRPTRIPSKTRGWSGAKTTPTTPVTTPTHSAKPRLPSARTPRSSGRSTPNTTPTTPTHCRRYICTFQRTPTTTPVRPSQSRPTSRPSSKPPSRSPSICSRLQECYNTVQPESVTAALRTDLDNKVLDIANQSRGFCGCKNLDCRKSHVKRVADGKYEICGRNVFVRKKSTGKRKPSVILEEPGNSKRNSKSPYQAKTSKKSALRHHRLSNSSLRKVHFPPEPDRWRLPDMTPEMVNSSLEPYLLKGKHVMVRVGGGWDTLEHYLLRHDPQQVTVFNLKSADPFLHIRAKYCSPTQSQASSSKGSPTRSRATPSRGTASGDPTPGNSSSEGTPPPPPSQEPQVPSSSPAVSSILDTGNSVPTTDSSMPNIENSKDLPFAEHNLSTTDKSAVTKDSVISNETNESIHHSTTEQRHTNESPPFPETPTSPTSGQRQMVNSTTFCIESNETVEPIPFTPKTSHSELSSSPESSCSIKGTPPPTSSTLSTPACATSTPQDLSLTPNGSSTTVGTPLPNDSIENEEI